MQCASADHLRALPCILGLLLRRLIFCSHCSQKPLHLVLLAAELSADLQNFRIAGLQNCRVAELQGCRAAGLQNCRIAGLQNCRIAGLQGCRIAGFGLLGGCRIELVCVAWRTHDTNKPARQSYCAALLFKRAYTAGVRRRQRVSHDTYRLRLLVIRVIRVIRVMRV